MVHALLPQAGPGLSRLGSVFGFLGPVPLSLAVDYLLFVLLAALGVIQLASATARLRGLYIFATPALGKVSGLLLVLIGYARFFLATDRNARGLEGFQQAVLFSAASLGAVLFTLALSSLLRHRDLVPKGGQAGGLSSLASMTFYQAFFRSGRRGG